jgi:hypothetical protein
MRSMFAVVTAFILSISSAQARALVRLQNVRGATSFSVVGCDVPSGSALGKTDRTRGFWYRSPLRRPKRASLKFSLRYLPTGRSG